MAVEIIDTLKPKNNGLFPVVEAEYVAVSDELRLSEALGQKAEQTDLEELSSELENKADTSDITNLQSQIDQIAQAAGTGSADTEVAQARVGADGTSYQTLKAHLDAMDSYSERTYDEVVPFIIKEYSFDNDTFTYEQTDIYVKAGETIIVETTETSNAVVDTANSTVKPSVSSVGLHEFTPDGDGFIRFYCKKFVGNVRFQNCKITSERGSSNAKAASQLLVEGAFDDIQELSTGYTELSDELSHKYDRYEIRTVTGLSLSDFEICPTEYTIVTYDDSEALQHGAISGYIFSKFTSGIFDVTFKLHQVGSMDWIALACKANSAIGFTINSTSGNVNLYTASGVSPLSGIYRNSNCRNVVADDTIRVKRDGTKIAIYLIDNNTNIPIFQDEWVDIYALYSESAEISESDVGIGIVSNTSARNVPIIYDVTKKISFGDHFMSYDEADSRLTALEEGGTSNPYKVDLILFMGQSNMAGRGNGAQAPAVTDGAGWEFRAISDPTKLYSITEPFGVNENVEGAIYDYLGGFAAKTGDLVPAFINAYYKYAKITSIGVSASEGGTRIGYWLPDTARYTDAKNRWNTAIAWLTSNGYTIRNKLIVWCQGETDGDLGRTKAEYKSDLETLAAQWFTNGCDKFFVIRIGNYNGEGTQTYTDIITAQTEVCQADKNIIMIDTAFAGMKDRDLMKDDFHYKQPAYNEVGTNAGINAALYVNTGKEPTMFDTENNTLYYSHKN